MQRIGRNNYFRRWKNLMTAFITLAVIISDTVPASAAVSLSKIQTTFTGSGITEAAASVQTNSKFETELLKFPEDYQTKLRKLHTAHPNWIFVAKKLDINWNTAVEMEARSSLDSSKCYSLLPNYSGKLFLSKASTDYIPASKAYLVKDGTDWVSASTSAVAYFMDPRNFMTDEYIFQFEATSYNSTYHTLAATEAVLAGTDMAGKKISYINTSGKTVSTSTTYAQAIYAAGVKYKISPLLLASKVRQETGANLKDGSNSGNFSYGGVSYRGYYNPYNIACDGTSAAQGSAIAKGLTFAMGGAKKTETTYGRPWNTPVKAFNGGAEYMVDKYIKNGQNTIYFKKFNTVSEPYYSRQYMQNLYATQAESSNIYKSYKASGILESSFVFYIPVYKNMPAYASSIKISKSKWSGKTTKECQLRSGPSNGYSSLCTIPKGAAVTVTNSAKITDTTVKRDLQIRDPYWIPVKYGTKSGYISLECYKADTNVTLPKGCTYLMNVTCADKKVRYETSDPLVATVSTNGNVKAIAGGTCMIYAINSTGSRVDCIGVKVDTTKLPAPSLQTVKNEANGIKFTWGEVPQATGYAIYRKTTGSWSKIATVSGGSTVSYTDKNVTSGEKYYYTVKALKGDVMSPYKSAGLALIRLSRPVLISAVQSGSSIVFKWNKVSGAAGYKVYRKTTGGWSMIGQVGSGTLQYKDVNVKKGMTYSYTVRAFAGASLSACDTQGKSVLYK